MDLNTNYDEKDDFASISIENYKNRQFGVALLITFAIY